MAGSVAGGGTAPNVVPPTATTNLRVPPVFDTDVVVNRVLACKPFGTDCRIEVTGGINRLPYDRNAGVAAVFEHAKTCAAKIGFVLEGTP
jgi:glutamate carboxypeptidase